jgi:hypothetical protein
VRTKSFRNPLLRQLHHLACASGLILVGHDVYDRSVKFRGSNFPRGREKLGSQNFRPQQFRPLRGIPPNFENSTKCCPWEHSQEISSKTVEPFPRNSTIHFGYFTPLGRTKSPTPYMAVRKRKKIDVDRILFS